MRRLALLLTLSLTGCGSADKNDLAYAGQARSLLAEAALIVESAPRSTPTYSREMQSEVGEQLATIAAESRASGGPSGVAIAAIATLPPSPGIALLNQRAAQARTIEQRIEGRLESR
jgi:hypothetical protein